MLLDLKELVKKYNLDIRGVVQAGSHWGEEAEIFLSLGAKNLLCFEPHPDTFKILKQNIGEKATLIQSALANFIGESEFYVEDNNTNQGQSNSMLEPLIHLQQYPHIQFSNKITVPVTKLDTFIALAPLYNFLASDCQGMDFEVLKGGTEFLYYIDYVMIEINREEVYKGCGLIGEVDEFLGKYGFERVETSFVGHTWDDAFYIKSN